mmetsp:Transcript_129883/g.416793  ORF Transcript_129883/g.416793 Transcript_129883/m.416793 type:complete len:617 (+) Transcript_129883:151-2001(+)
MPAKDKKVCYYELLGNLDRKCEAQEIKTAYRKLALRMHPDKAAQHNLTVEDATAQFQQIQEAYSVLSDPQERAWYDAHREQILKGHDDGEPAEDPFKTKINLFNFFSSSCYKGFGDDNAGFFAVYADLFTAIDTEEEEWEDLDSDEDHVAMPPFGRSDTEHADVSAFYRHWLEFVSRKAFAHADKWNPKEAPNRQVRRAMETENKVARKAAKKEFNAEVRQLVKFVQKRDPRIIAYQKHTMKESVEKAARDSAEKELRKVSEAKDRKERQEAAREAEEARWAEVKLAKEARKARGEVVSEDEAANSEDEEEEVHYVCEACNKKFKSEKAYDSHAKSKKHVQVVESLRRELEQDMKAEKKAAEAAAAAAAAEVDDDDSEASDSDDDGAVPASASNDKAAEKSEEEDDDDESDEDAFLARFANARRGGGGANFAPPARGGASASSSSDEGEVAAGTGAGAAAASAAAAAAEGAAEGDSDDDERARRPATAGKAAAAAAEEGAVHRAQKKAQQRELLLQKKAEKDKVEELVRQVKKGGVEGSEVAEATSPAAAGAGVAAPSKPKSNAAPAAAAEGAKCDVCGVEFTSRTKLFQHIKETGHAALKTMPDAAGAKAKKKRR